MADVTGDIGGQSVQLNNAATEATLKQLLAVAQAQLAAQGKKGAELAKLQADLDKKLKSIAGEAKKAASAIEKEKKARDKNTDAVDDNTDSIEEETTARERAAQSLKNFSANTGKALTLLKGAIDLVVNTASTLANMGNSMSSAAQAFEVIPGAGAQLAKTFGAVGAAAEKTYKAFQTASSVGANFNGSIATMVKAASDAGLTFDDFTGLISQNAGNLRFLGGTTAEGAKRLAELSKDIRKSQLGRDLAGLGFTTAETAEGIARMAAMQRRSGNREELNREQLISQTGSYLKNLDAVSKITGKTKDALQKEADARRNDAQFRIAERRIIKEDRGNLNNFMDSLGDKALQDAFKEMQATGTLAGDASQKLMRVSPEVAQAMLQTARASRESGRFTQEMADQTEQAMMSAARRDEEAGRLTVQSAFNASEIGEAAVAVMDLAARGSTTAEERAKSDAAAAELQKKRDAGLAEATDPAGMKAFQEQVAETSNQFTLVLAQGLPKFQEAFTALTNTITGPLETAFDTFIDNLEIAAAALLALTALQGGSSLLGDRLGKKSPKKGPTGGKTPKAKVPAGAGDAAKEAAEKAAKEAAEKAAKEGTEKAAEKGAAKVAAKVGLKFVPFLGLAYTAIDSAIAAVDAAKNAEDVLGIEGRKATAGETAAAATGGVVDALTFGMISRESVAQGMSNWFSLGPSQQADAAKEATEKAAEETKKNTDATKKAAEENKKSTEATKENTEATKEAAKETTPKTPSEPNWMDPTSTLKYFKELQTSPGSSVVSKGATTRGITSAPSAPAHDGLGGMAAAFESGKAGSQAVGWDSTGGTSYGKYQIAAKTGTMDKFMEHLKKTNEEAYERLSKAGPADAGKGGAFAEEWKKLAKEGKLQQSEHDFIKKTHYDKGAAGLKDENLKGMLEKSKTLQEVMWSTSVQHGGGGASGIFNKVYKKDMSEEDLIKSIYAERGTRFGSSTPQVRASVQNRFAQEQQLALGMVGQPGNQLNQQVASSGQQSYMVNGKPATKEKFPNAADILASANPSQTTPISAAPAVAAAVSTTTQDTPASLLASLNTKLDTLIALQSKQNTISERGNRLTKGMTNDLYVSA
jgi:hypothetical protein